MNKRQLEIIEELKEHAHTLESLAEKFGVSQRTIRNDLNKINDNLSSQGSGYITLQSGGRIEVPEGFSSVSNEADEGDFYNYKLSKEERKMVAATLLINAPGYITLNTIAETLYVSRATIISDLNDIKAFIKEGGLEVTSHANKGLLVEGKESDKRSFLFQLSAFEDKKGNGRATAVNVEAGSRTIIRKIISEQEQMNRMFLSDSSFLRIRKYLGIMLSRNLQGDYIEPQPFVENDKIPFAQSILKYIAQYFDVQTTMDEINYLSQMLDQCRYIKKQDFNVADLQIQMLTRRFIHKVSEELGQNLEQDYDFFEALSNHLESMFKASAANFPENDDLAEIAGDHPMITNAVRNSVGILERYADREFTENEFLYIVIHVCAAMERKKNSEISFHVVIACHAGIGTSQLLMERLKKNFNFHIVDIISAHEATYVDPAKADLIISTVPLENCSVDHVVVSPVLSDEDYLRLGSKIDVLRNSRNLPSRIETDAITATGLIERISPIVFEQVPDAAPELMKLLKKEIRSYFHQEKEAESEIFAPALHHLLTPDHIQLDIACADWREAIQKSALPLLKDGYIEERYISAMISNIEENGPYVVLSPGFALPHEGLEAGSVQVGMNLIRLKTPVEFGADELDPVEFVCCLSAVDHKMHLRALFNMVNMLQDKDFKEALRKAEDPKEVAKVIETFEYMLDKK